MDVRSHRKVDITDQLRIARIRQLFEQSRPGLVGAFISAVILVIALRDVVPLSLLIGWLACYSTLQVVRHIHVSAFYHRAPEGRDVLPWGRWFAVLTASSGLTWGLAGVVLFPAQSLAHQFLLAIFVAGISAAAAVVYAPAVECYLPTILAGLTPIALKYISQGDEFGVTIGAVILLYALVLVLTAGRMHAANSDSLKLRFEKNDLIESLIDQKGRTEELNRSLTAEIEERNQAERELKFEKEKFRILSDHAPFGMVLVGGDNRFRYINSKFEGLFGYTLDDIPDGKEWLNRAFPDGELRRVAKKAWMEGLHALNGSGTHQREFTVNCKSGRRKIILFRPVRLDTGETLMTCEDVTEQRARENELRRSEETANALINASADAAALLDAQGKVLACNEVFERRVGRSGAEISGASFSELLPPVIAEDRMRRRREVMRTGRAVRFTDADGDTFRDNIMYPVFGARGEVDRLAIFERDITEHVLSERRLREAKDAAEAASLAKSRFLANMSHELRTPLNAIIGFSEILEDQTFGLLNETQMRHVGHVLAAGRQLLELINEILDLSKIESGKMDVRISRLNVRRLLRNSVDMMREQAVTRGIDLSLGLSDDLGEASLFGDALRFNQILSNLISNAIKFTPDGGRVRVKSWVEDDRVFVSVSDTGVGLRAEDQERIFKAFEQVDSSFGRYREGTGLGLAVTRRLVELHGGSISVTSPGEGLGSTFTFSLPLDGRAAG